MFLMGNKRKSKNKQKNFAELVEWKCKCLFNKIYQNILKAENAK